MGDWGLLGSVLAEKAGQRDQANVQELVAHAKSLLQLVPETFPNYTAHDEVHAGNVIRLMGELAAPRRDRMSGLEAALLILAAYFHDTGMAFSADERAGITDDDEFEEFLDGHDEAYLATQRNGGVPPDFVVEQYCRSRHADRVRVHLDAVDRSLLQWENKPIIDALEMVCRSHNEPTAALYEPRFRTDYLYGADLRFCAVALRLGDILDLDDSRTPTVIYDHLRLADRRTPEASVSDREWRKHLAARGFEFPPQRSPNYRVQFVAEPSDPGVEHDLRTFLSIIEEEMLHCRSVVDYCGERWRGVPLPGEIDKLAITSNGYRYGEFRFELDRAAVLELFTGERLYEDPHAFIRELLQNAFDAVRAREHLFGHLSTGIKVTCWEDDGGFVWVSVDDDGIGMDEHTLRDYFLRVGKSYYRSAEFRASLGRRGVADQPFEVISRFGVGVLACFMVGDRVEVSSRAAGENGGRAVRLSINRRDDYFVLQDSSRKGRPMPGRGGPTPAFRKEPGTRIAVRINPNYATTELATVVAKVNSYVMAPPIPVSCNGEPVKVASLDFTTNPVLSEPVVKEVDTAELKPYSPDNVLPFLGTVQVAAIPLNLTRVAECPDVQGQLVAYVILPPADDESADLLKGWPVRNEELRKTLNKAVMSTKYALHFHKRSYEDGTARYIIQLSVDRIVDSKKLRHAYQTLAKDTYRTTEESAPTRASTAEQWSSFLAESPLELALVLKRHLDIDGVREQAYAGSEYSIRLIDLPCGPELAELLDRRHSWWSHNGIALPAPRPGLRELELDVYNAVLLGNLSLSGQLRPDLSVSRSDVRAVRFGVQSGVHLAIRHALRHAIGSDERLTGAFDQIGTVALMHAPAPAEPYTASTLRDDLLLRNGVWNTEAVIDTAGGKRSVDQIAAAVRAGGRPTVNLPYVEPWSRSGGSMPFFYDYLAAGLIHFFLDVEYDVATRSFAVASDRTPEHHAGTLSFPPLFAVTFRGPEKLIRTRGVLNLHHPLTQWMVNNATVLERDFPAPFQRVFWQAGSLQEVGELNRALEQVALSRPDIAPPPAAYARQDDAGLWWSR
ncbi:HD domain-containing protein [Paractinoplanes maris]|uniref:HD domain-containing protein n=1 Tax=Paractinoplanes maris TaxID=1734446 RepID=UPI002021D05E|nr:ATP-binding protein [Actinoplanes maris]